MTNSETVSQGGGNFFAGLGGLPSPLAGEGRVRGKKWKESSFGCRKALLPLKKGGRKGFLARYYQRASPRAEVRLKR
jgi:hypothetical protein